MLSLKHTDDHPTAMAIGQDTHSEDLAVQSVSLAESVGKRLSVDSSYGGMMTFFDRAFRIETDEDSKLLSGENENKTCCLLLYNIGCCHHALGIQGGCQDELSKAFKLYRMALEFVTFNESTEDDDTLLMLSLAVMNNVAHIQSFFFHYDEVRHCVSWLRQAAQHFQPSSLSEEDYMFFFLRFFVLPTNELHSSPAA